MTREEKFKKICDVSESGIDFLNRTLYCFCPDLPERGFDNLKDSIISLIKSERIDAAACTADYMYCKER